MLLSGNILGVTTIVAYVDSDGGFYGYNELLKNKEIVSRFPNLLLTSSGDLAVPYLVDETATSFAQMFDIFLSLKEQINDTVLSQIKGTLDSQINLPIETYKKLFECTIALVQYLGGHVITEIDFPVDRYVNFGSTKKLVDKMNASAGVSFSRVKGNNNTLFMKTPEDELYVTVPTADSLSYYPPSNFIPALSSIFVPYKDPKLKSTDYKRYLDASGTRIEEVEGSNDNITSDLYENEKRFYNALCDLHKTLLSIEYPDKSIEHCEEFKVSSPLFRNYITEFVIKALAYHWNHNGYLPVALEQDNDDIYSDDYQGEDTGSSETATSNKLFAAIRSDLSDGESIIASVIAKEFTKDIFYPINLLIQCLRFGDRKPSKLKLFGEREFFNLKTFTYTTSSGSYSSYEIKQTPSGCNLTVHALIQANSRIFDGRFISNNSIVKPIIDVPVGMICKKEFKGTDEIQYVIVSFVDFISNYGKDSFLTIEGVTVENGSIKFTESFPKSIFNLEDYILLNEALLRFNGSSDGFFLSYVPSNVKETYMDFNCFNNKLCSLALFNALIEKSDLITQEIYNCVSAEELNLKCTDYRMPPANLLNVTLGLNYCKLLAKVNDGFAMLEETRLDLNLVDVLSIYTEFMNEQEFYGDVFFMPTLTSNTQNTTQNLSSSNVFGNESNPNGNTIVKESVPSQVVEKPVVAQSVVNESVVISENPLSSLFEDKDFDKAINIIMTHAEIQKVNEALEASKSKVRVKNLGNYKTNVVVGYLGISEDKTFYFLEPNGTQETTQQSYSLVKFKSNMIGLLRILVNGKKCKVKFKNEEVFNYYASIVEKI